MEAVILVGLQASGKSTFYKQNFLNSHIRISMDLMKTRNREKKFFDLCLETQAKVVIDNTNPSLVERKSYIEQLKKSGYKISGYYFSSSLEGCLERNSQRIGKELVPKVGVLATYNKLVLPSYKEGFDDLFYVIMNSGEFLVEKWNDEI